MNFNKIAVVSLLFVVTWGCKTTQVSTVKQSEKDIALSSSSLGDYNQAVISWQTYFDHQNRANQEIRAEDYAKAASDAFKTENSQLTITWFDAARQAGYSGEDMHLALSEVFRKQNNLSRELTSLNYLADYYPETAASKGIYPRLFEIYMETDKKKAYELWKMLNEADQSKEPYLNSYFILNKSLEYNTVVDSLANVLLLVNPKHIEALEWNGEKYYWLGENRYQREMEKYNKRKTHVQYQFLLNELKIVAEDFKRSRDYFEKLWAIEKLPRYASFLSNIYARLDNQERANFFNKFAK